MCIMLRVLEMMIGPHYLLALGSHDCLAHRMGREYGVFVLEGGDKKCWRCHLVSLEHLELDLRQKSDFGCEMNWSQSVTAA
ncbi:hypothetical protein F2Q68_00033751 [Brassica cretica]|uniref:Uncharacterized protein n=1 Tax=Brassica cretica TaxID=69181 RepID=A0A8S9H5X7_BRACR|nr:hypothetical protein F2Q68_00033751 [Brassica cretica]